ncbi:MAG: hypothetical protein KJT01_08145 [Gemmatimonadetes bacterium]|nr:hypothetical protein [Gemmatimonadota bacterium]
MSELETLAAALASRGLPKAYTERGAHPNQHANPFLEPLRGFPPFEAFVKPR